MKNYRIQNQVLISLRENLYNQSPEVLNEFMARLAQAVGKSKIGRSVVAGAIGASGVIGMPTKLQQKRSGESFVTSSVSQIKPGDKVLGTTSLTKYSSNEDLHDRVFTNPLRGSFKLPDVNIHKIGNSLKQTEVGRTSVKTEPIPDTLGHRPIPGTLRHTPGPERTTMSSSSETTTRQVANQPARSFSTEKSYRASPNDRMSSNERDALKYIGLHFPGGDGTKIHDYKNLPQKTSYAPGEHPGMLPVVNNRFPGVASGVIANRRRRGL